MATAREYIRFEELETPRKTKMWAVVNISSNHSIGEVKWYAPWRQYCFFPDAGTIWNFGCLVYIEEFMERQIREHRDG